MKGFTSKLLIVLTLCMTGVGVVWGESNDWLNFPIFGQESSHEVGKKVSAVKPKFKSADQKKFSADDASRTDQYTFFTVLNDPSLSKMVGLNGEIVKKGHPASVQTIRVKSAAVRESRKKPSLALPVMQPTPVTPPKREIQKEVELAKASVPVSVTPSKPLVQEKVELAKRSESAPLPEIGKTSDPAIDLKKALEEFEKLLTSPSPAPITSNVSKNPPIPAPAQDLQYAVQVSSFRKKEQAHALKTKLMKKGYSAFVKRIELPGNKGIWYRVYMGRYIDRSSAKDAAARFEKAEKLPSMVIRQEG